MSNYELYDIIIDILSRAAAKAACKARGAEKENEMVQLFVKWSPHAELVKMTISMGKKKIFDDLISKTSLKEIGDFFNETLKDHYENLDRKTGETTITGSMSDDDLQELYDYFDIEQR